MKNKLMIEKWLTNMWMIPKRVMNKFIYRKENDERLVKSAKFDTAMTAINFAISAAAFHELQLNRLKGAELTAVKLPE